MARSMWTIAFEERDLIAQYGARYRAYREQVGMLLPRRPRKVEQEKRTTSGSLERLARENLSCRRC